MQGLVRGKDGEQDRDGDAVAVSAWLPSVTTSLVPCTRNERRHGCEAHDRQTGRRADRQTGRQAVAFGCSADVCGEKGSLTSGRRRRSQTSSHVELASLAVLGGRERQAQEKGCRHGYTAKRVRRKLLVMHAGQLHRRTSTAHCRSCFLFGTRLARVCSLWLCRVCKLTLTKHLSVSLATCYRSTLPQPSTPA